MTTTHPPAAGAATAAGATAAESERGIRCDILTGQYHAPNGGLSATVSQVTLLDSRLPELTTAIRQRGDWPVRMQEPSASAPAVRLAYSGGPVALPVQQPGNCAGPMASGAWIYSSDERFRIITGDDRPIRLHDRFESWSDYAVLSGG